ncbi:MAG: NAD(P)H-dependent glycerol-3-phosphate dehydrogenase [Endomicrobiales bacterium]|jgi:glycerol-3-phosphate dehydrogenase (NAD(P)+)
MTTTVAVLGAGSWGVTLAGLLHDKGCKVTLWEFNDAQAKALTESRMLSFFPYARIPAGLTITSDLTAACAHAQYILFAVPSHTLRSVSRQLSETKLPLTDTIIISATKGIENNSLKRMSEIISAELPAVGNRIVALSGPSHAEEVAQKHPTAIVVASINSQSAEQCQDLFMTPQFRVYTNTDIIGVETGAALKNILAIAAGIIDGIGLGDNCKAAMVTRGLTELMKLGIAMGGRKQTFFGLTGIGDLIVTCYSRHSRNRSLGEKIGHGIPLSRAEKELIMVAEGVRTTQSAYELGKYYNLELPIIQQMYSILYEGKSPRESVKELMIRDSKPEMELFE